VKVSSLIITKMLYSHQAYKELHGTKSRQELIMCEILKDVTFELPVNILMELHTCTLPESLPTLTADNPFLVERTNSTATGASINLDFVPRVPEVLKVSGFV
jgi:hypothetical protein